MRLKLLFVLTSFLLVSGIILLNGTSIDFQYQDFNEESAKKREWERQQLADPATGEIPVGYRLKELSFLKEYYQTNKNNVNKKTRGVTWNSRGPWNVGGRTRAFAIDVANENHIIAGQVSGGIWQSNDAGATWTKVSDPNANQGIVSITQDPRIGKSNIWYATSGELYGNSASATSAYYLGDGAFKSIDNGNTWQPITSTSAGVPSSFSTNFQGSWRIAASPVDTVNTCVYLATYGSIYRSRDTGNTWTNVLGISNDSYTTDVAVSKTGKVYATLSADGTTTKGIFRSGDGVNFTNITPTFLSNYNRLVIEINPNDENEIYILGLLDSINSGGVTSYNYEGDPEYVCLLKYNYISGDGSGTGGVWTNLSANLPVTSPNQFDKFNCQGGYDLCIRMQPGSNTIIIGGTNLYRSTDGFTTPNNTTQIGGYGIATQLWNFIVYPNHHPDQHDIHFLPSDPSKMYTANDGGVFFTNDVNATSVQWIDKSKGYVTTQFYTVNIDESKSFDQYILGGLQDNGNYLTNSNNLQTNWQMTINGDGAFNYIAPNRDFYVISTQLGNMRKVTLDNNGIVLAKKRIDPAGYTKENYNFINAFIVNPNDNNYLYMAFGKRIAVLNNLTTIPVVNDTSKLTTGWSFSTDTIKAANIGSSNTIPAEITAFGISKTPANVMYVGTSSKHIYKVSNALTTNPQMILTDTLGLPSKGNVSGIAVDPEDANKVLICYSNYNVTSLFYTENGGQKWYLVGGNLEKTANSSSTNPSIRCVGILKQDNGKRRFFAGTSIGLFSTDSLVLGINNGTNTSVWTQESPTLIGSNVVTDLKIRQADGYIVIGTHGGGVFDSYYTNKYPAAVQTYIQPNVFIYPNPAKDELNMTFQTQQNKLVKAAIYDLSGRNVMTVLDEKTVQNTTLSKKINISNLPNGHYFLSYRLDENNKPNVQHFVIHR